jgi:hypothetical protein
MIGDSKKAEWGAHGARGRWILDDLNLTRLHEDTIVWWTREVGDAFDRAIILPNSFGKFNANPFACRERRRAEKANDSATERYFNNGADVEVDGGCHCPGRERRGDEDANIRSRYCIVICHLVTCAVLIGSDPPDCGGPPHTLDPLTTRRSSIRTPSWHHAHRETEWTSKRYVS